MRFAVQDIDEKWLKLLLLDHTTGRNIIWATDDYAARGQAYSFTHEITMPCITGPHNERLIAPRVYKDKYRQSQRTKDKAEVFTPSWVCNAQNNLVDDAWFARENVFNIASDDNRQWRATEEKIIFPKGKTWQDYVLANRLEITCGEAPYLVSRYDTTTGEIIALDQRIGMLDRKLRVVKENTKSLRAWQEWAVKAFQATYGFEYQGDSLLVGRINLFKTFQEYFAERSTFFAEHSSANKRKVKPDYERFATIISLNLWQMDGLTFTIPGGQVMAEKVSEQLSLWDDEIDDTDDASDAADSFDESTSVLPLSTPYCVIKDWTQDTTVTFKSLLKNK